MTPPKYFWFWKIKSERELFCSTNDYIFLETVILDLNNGKNDYKSLFSLSRNGLKPVVR